MRGLFVTVVLDGVGIGAQPDAADYGDAGSDTLGHVLEARRPTLPNLARLGLGNIRALPGIEPRPAPDASFGRLTEVSAGKDSTTGHWELAGLVLDRPFPIYPDGFPADVVERFRRMTGAAGVLGNVAASGTAILDDLGARHVETGWPILYTSADSVFQVAAHLDVVPLDTLYAWCEGARREICTGSHAVGRVIARPFDGNPGAWRRRSEKRRDYALEPAGLPVQEAVRRAGVRTVSIGKVADLFAGYGFDESHKTRDNEDGLATLLRTLADLPRPAFVWVNLVDFDQEFGHRNDPAGFAAALERFDASIPPIEALLRPGDRLVLTADHGNDPTFPGTDHTREHVPLLVRDGRTGIDLGLRASFADHAASVAAYFDVPFETAGQPF